MADFARHGINQYQNALHGRPLNFNYRTLLERSLIPLQAAAAGTWGYYKYLTMNTPPLNLRGPPAVAPTRPAKRARVSFQCATPSRRAPLVFRSRMMYPRYQRRIVRRSRPYVLKPRSRSVRRRYGNRRRRRSSYRRYRRRRVVWSRPDIWRLQTNVTFLDPAKYTIANIVTTPTAWAKNHVGMQWFTLNPAAIWTSLGAHGMFDRQIISTQAFSGTANPTNLTTAGNALANNIWRNNNKQKIMCSNIEWIYRLTPDWQSQGVPDINDAAGAKFSNVGNIVFTFYRLTCRTRMLLSDLAPFVSTNRLMVNAAWDGTLGTAVPTDAGFFAKWARGLESRIGNKTVWGATNSLFPYTAAPDAASNPSPLVLSANNQYLCADGVSLYHSPDLVSRFAIKRVSRKVINPGNNATVRVRMPSFVLDSRDAQWDLPGTIAFADYYGKYVPKGFSLMLVQMQTFSPQPNLTVMPPVAFQSEVIYKMKTRVMGSTLGGNLFYLLDSQPPIGSDVTVGQSTFPMPSDPGRAPVLTPVA